MARNANKAQKSASKQQGRIAEAKKQQRKQWLMWGGIGAVVVFAAFAFFKFVPAPEQSASAQGQASVGAPAPEVQMESFSGEAVTLSEFEGTPVVLNFWATWCPFCVAEMPDFEKVNQAADGQVQFIGVNLQDDAGAADDLVGDTGVTYLLTRDPQGVVYGAFGGVAMPTTVFIGADGIVDEIVTGALTEGQLSNKIVQHFADGA
jgi:thiol-disulfide isomerase/thioredoxin